MENRTACPGSGVGKSTDTLFSRAKTVEGGCFTRQSQGKTDRRLRQVIGESGLTEVI